MTRRHRRTVPTALGMALLLLLAACGGSDDPEPTLIGSRITATEGLNPTTDNRPAPVVLRIYELTDNRKFLSAGFFDLFDNDDAFLGPDLLAKTELVIPPGQDLPIQRQVSDQTRYIGILAGFRDVESANWRASLPIEPEDDNSFTVILDARSVSVRRPEGGFLGVF